MAVIKTVGIKYCGGCNSQIERGEVAKAIEALLPEGFQLAADPAALSWDIGILISGCGTACADTQELRTQAPFWISVGGTSVDYVSVPEKEIARMIAEKLSRMA